MEVWLNLFCFLAAIEPFLLYSTSSQLMGRQLPDVNVVALPAVSNISNISAIDYHARKYGLLSLRGRVLGKSGNNMPIRGKRFDD